MKSAAGMVVLSTLAAGLIGACASRPIATPAPASRPAAHVRAYLHMPPRADGPIPQLLSQTGAFKDIKTLTPIDGLTPYDINVSFWSDGAAKHRWIALPEGGQIGFDAVRPWSFPAGTVFVKHFEYAVDSNRARRLETRLLVRDADGGVYGVTYRWREDGSDADRVDDRLLEPLHLTNPFGEQVTWTYPGRADCVTCHTPASGGVLGVNARQLHRSDGSIVTQWDEQHVFDRRISASEIATIQPLSPASDASSSVEWRARSYLDANCSQCHQPGGVAGNFDARISTPLKDQNLVDGPVLINLGLDRARVIAPHDPWRSVLLARMSTTEQPTMPPLAHSTIDQDGVALIRHWIESLPGPDVLAPPQLLPAGGKYTSPVRVAFRSPDPQAQIHYTLDGSAPTSNAPMYIGPIELTRSTTVRARAYRDGYMRSIVTQDTFEIGD